MLYSEIIAVCSQIHTKHINKVCGEDMDFVNVVYELQFLSSWWWAVCRPKHVEQLRNIGIINSATRLHLVGSFCEIVFILSKTGHGPHCSTLVVICVVRLLFVLFYVLFVCKCVLLPGDNPIAVNKCINIIYEFCGVGSKYWAK
jgi:hypothetical protein